MKTVLGTIAMAAVALSLSGADCTVLTSGQTVEVSFSKTHPTCFDVALAADEASQVILDGPLDLAIHLAGGINERLIDAFEFGRETATLRGPARYRVTVRALAPVPAGSQVVMSRRSLPLQAAQAWLRAEELATRSKVEPTMDNTLQSLQAWEILGDIPAIARIRITRGVLAYGAGKYRDAIQDFERAHSLCSDIGNTRCVAEAITNQGIAVNRIGEYGNAIQLTENAIANWRQLHDPLNLGKTLSNLGIIYWRIRDLQSAISASDQAAKLLKGRDEVGYATALNNLGLCYQVLAEYDQSTTYFHRALEVFERYHKSDAVRARLNLGRTLYLNGDPQNARVLLEEAITRSGNDRFARAEAQSNLGQVYLKLQMMDAAGPRFQAALGIFQAMGDRRNEAAVDQYLGLLARNRRESTEAAVWFERALAIRTALGLREDTADSLFALAELDRDADRIDAARERAERALELLESVRLDVPGPALRASFYARKRSLFDLLVDLEAAPSGPKAAAAALLATERGRSRSLLDQLADGRLLKRIPPELESRRKQIQHQIDVQTAELGRADEEHKAILREQLRRLISEDGAVEAQVRSGFGRDLTRPLPSVEELQRTTLPDDSALVEYHLGERQSYLWLVERTKVRMWRLPARNTIEREVHIAATLFGQIRERLMQPAQRMAFERAIQRLSVTLLGPLAGLDLPPRLILAPDTALLPLPFAALRLPGESRALGLEHDLIQVPSAGYLLAGNPVRPLSGFPKTILAFADPVYSADDPRVRSAVPAKAPAGASLSRLPFTAELDVAASLVPPARRRILRGFDARRSYLEHIPLDQYAVLGFSSHALIDNQTPELSRLALTLVDQSGRPVDGFLRPYQLARMRLNGSVVVLSACDTALGKQVPGEGLIGLENSLLYAGAGQLVLTLTQVDAEGSSHLLAEAYRGLFGSRRLSIEKALTLARRRLEGSVRWHDPYFWASFIIIGKLSEEPPQ